MVSARSIVCVTEKPSIAKALANALAGGSIRKKSTENKYIWNYEFAYNSLKWGSCEVIVTSVSGHITDMEFPPPFDKFDSDAAGLFNAPIRTFVTPSGRKIAKNLEQLSRRANTLFIWTDCDREGEHIGGEVYEIARKCNPRIEIFRAVFNNAEVQHLKEAFDKPARLDFNQVQAVDVRRELDLRSGYSLTRLQTQLFRQYMGPNFRGRAVQYGSCQFPTLGFVVDRYLKIQNFKAEQFWTIEANTKDSEKNKVIKLNWKRGRIFDHLTALMFYEQAWEKGNGLLKIIGVKTKPATRYKVLPLTTVVLQKKGTSALKMSAKTIMDHAEKLYNDGYVSYPRTETDRFDPAIDLKKLVSKHASTQTPWSPYAKSLLDNNAAKFNAPRAGKHDDEAHPPIHPVQSVHKSVFGSNTDRWRVYEFICRYFLACCSNDAKGLTTTIDLNYGGEEFQTSGDQIIELNFLEVYPYMKWTGTILPNWKLNDEVVCSSFNLKESQTTPPKLLTEPDLVGLMDANGIGTDATMADHIVKIQDREYVKKKGIYFEPTKLGIALVQGYDKLKLENSLTKPFLRRDTEIEVSKVASGAKRKADVLQKLVKIYEKVFIETKTRKMELINEAKTYLTP
ncbi:DNA topoisomerase 3 [Starmerella bacillaris]|uniref:DNA topoisomerase n=1 Tax=Starmerella bacillaris TaxID=1247836 RepID=A0AAV5RMN9_STABA|nr:DNA topoisomerase 3 [Starmerella bacillaris]